MEVARKPRGMPNLQELRHELNYVVRAGRWMLQIYCGMVKTIRGFPGASQVSSIAERATDAPFHHSLRREAEPSAMGSVSAMGSPATRNQDGNVWARLKRLEEFQGTEKLPAVEFQTIRSPG